MSPFTLRSKVNSVVLYLLQNTSCYFLKAEDFFLKITIFPHKFSALPKTLWFYRIRVLFFKKKVHVSLKFVQNSAGLSFLFRREIGLSDCFQVFSQIRLLQCSRQSTGFSKTFSMHCVKRQNTTAKEKLLRKLLFRCYPGNVIFDCLLTPTALW